jgi:hypothetical protein
LQLVLDTATGTVSMKGALQLAVSTCLNEEVQDSRYYDQEFRTEQT